MQRNLIYFLYRVLLIAAFPLIVLYVLVRGWRNRRYFSRLTERFGKLPLSFQRTTNDAIWLHAVSVGEVLSCTELVRRLRSELPNAPVFLSCGTRSGRDAAEAALAGETLKVFYVPFDYIFAVRRVLRRIRPAVVVVLETEIWPNLFREVNRAGVPLLIINGRISDKAFPQYRRHRWFFRHVLSFADEILTGSEVDQQRYLAVGANSATTRSIGNLKYDFNPRIASVPAAVQRFWENNAHGQLWIVASSVGPEFPGDVDEDDATLAAYKLLLKTHPDLSLTLAPRKPERFEAVADKLRRSGLPFVKRTELIGSSKAQVLLLDTIGELGGLFGTADVVFMGGTLAKRGGHNVLEPAIFGKPIIVGPHLENFASIQEHFRKGAGFLEIDTPDQLATAVSGLLDDPESARALGNRARVLAEAERGATAEAVQAIVSRRWQHIPRSIPYGPLRPLLKALAFAWTIGSKCKRMRSSTRRLATPVISIGGLSMGGSGKTPMARHLTSRFHALGYRPAILTRGYRRKWREQVTILAPGATASTSVTGDEAQLYVRDGIATLGIGADRYVSGSAVEKQFHPDLFVLDDGFQHARLHRDFDLVLLDGLDPFGGGAVFPCGFLREPLQALHRADAIVITRSEGRRFDGVLERLSQLQVTAPVYFAQVVATDWIAFPSTRCEPPSGRVLRFCGLANPAAFESTLAGLNIQCVDGMVYPDHHRYTASDITAIRKRAETAGALWAVTTEKDAINLPEETSRLLAPIQLVYLRIGLILDDEESLLTQLTAVLKMRRQ